MGKRCKMIGVVATVATFGCWCLFNSDRLIAGSNCMTDKNDNLKKQEIGDTGGGDKQQVQRFIFATDPKAMSVLEKMTKRSKEKRPVDSHKGNPPIQIGKLSVCLVSEPMSWAKTQSPFSKWLNVVVDGRDLLVIESLIGQNGDDIFPMLTRINSLDEDIIFSPQETKALLKECAAAQVLSIIGSEKLETLKKLDAICRFAVQMGYGVYLASE